MNTRHAQFTSFFLAVALLAGCQTASTSSTSADKPAGTITVTKGGASTDKVSSTTDAASTAALERAAAAAINNPSLANKPSDKPSSAFAPKPALPATPYDKAGFVTKVDDGRLWVFKDGAKELAEFVKHGELVKSVTKIAVGPSRMTVRSSDVATIDAYLAAEPKTVNLVLPSSEFDKAGFVTKVDEGRLWVLKKDSKEVAEFVKHGELVKSVTKIGVGPNRMTVRSSDAATLDAYLAAEPKTVNAPAGSASADPYARPGFVTKLKDGRLWVFMEGAKELEEFAKHGELVKSVTRVSAGPNRISLRSGDAATIDAYLAAWK